MFRCAVTFRPLSKQLSNMNVWLRLYRSLARPVRIYVGRRRFKFTASFHPAV